MAKIGIITCQILELEFAHMLNADAEVADVFVIDSEFSAGLLSELKIHGKKPVHRLAALGAFETTPIDGHHVLVRVMELGLHSDIKNLQHHVVSAVKEMARHVNSVLLGYGLCGNALNHAGDLFSEVGIPVMLPMDEDHPVDDCVGLIIGGRENYYARQCECAGTMFMNAGFSRHWQKIMDSDTSREVAPEKRQDPEAHDARLQTQLAAANRSAGRNRDDDEHRSIQCQIRPPHRVHPRHIGVA